MSLATKNLIGAIGIGAALFVFWTFNYDTWGQISIYKDEIKIRQDALEERRKTLDELKEYGEKYRSQSEDIKRFSLIIPTKKDIEYVLSTMATVAGDSAIQIRDLSITESKAAGDGLMGTVSIAASLTGSLEGFLAFLDNVESNIRIMDTQTVTAKRSGSGDLLDFDIKIDTYIAK